MENKKLQKIKISKWQDVMLAVLALAIILSAGALGFRAGDVAFATSDYSYKGMYDKIVSGRINLKYADDSQVLGSDLNSFYTDFYFYGFGDTLKNKSFSDLAVFVYEGNFSYLHFDEYLQNRDSKNLLLYKECHANDVSDTSAFYDGWNVSPKKIFTQSQIDNLSDGDYSIVFIFSTSDGGADRYHQIATALRCVKATPVELPADPTKPGHTFAGWYYDEALTQPYKQGDIITEDTTLYAKFIVNNYAVKYYVNGELVETKTVQYGGKAENLALTEAGYTYSAWCVDQATQSGYDFDTNTVSGDLDLYATKAVIMLKVTFLVDGTTYRVLDVPYGSALISVIKATAAGDIIDNLQIFNAQTQTYEIATADTLVVSDITAQAHVIDGLEGWLKFGAWMNKYWLWLVIGIAAAAVLSVVIVVIYKRA